MGVEGDKQTQIPIGLSFSPVVRRQPDLEAFLEPKRVGQGSSYGWMHRTLDDVFGIGKSTEGQQQSQWQDNRSRVVQDRSVIESVQRFKKSRRTLNNFDWPLLDEMLGVRMTRVGKRNGVPPRVVRFRRQKAGSREGESDLATDVGERVGINRTRRLDACWGSVGRAERRGECREPEGRAERCIRKE